MDSQAEIRATMRTSLWKGYARRDFTLGGREAIIVEPAEAAQGRPWVWRAEFFDAFPSVDMAMLARGWHLAYYCVSDMYGCPAAVELMRGFHREAEAAFGLSGRAALFGFSRGGLYAFNYAASHPEKVSVLYLDAPVLDINTWPKRKAPREWQECLDWYGLTQETAEAFRGNPLDRIEPVFDAEIPIVIVAGGADDVVPYERNGAVLLKRYKELGGVIEAIVKPLCGHHPHSLEDPTPVVEFLLREAAY